MRLQAMTLVKLPVGYKCRLFGLSRNSLGRGEYSYDHGDGHKIEFRPPKTMQKVR
jgi:hypothetical protein